MKKLIQIVTLLMISLFVFAASKDQMIMESKHTIKQFAEKLKSKLQQGMQSGGPVEAIQVCNTAAERIARLVFNQNGWKIARTSLKVRNTNNTPDEWEEKVLQDFEQRKDNGEAIEQLDYSEVITESDSKVFRYMKAIPTEGLCLSCHGDKLPDNISEKLSDLYPEDQATGFSIGDIRGAFSITREIE